MTKFIDCEKEELNELPVYEPTEVLIGQIAYASKKIFERGEQLRPSQINMLIEATHDIDGAILFGGQNEL